MVRKNFVEEMIFELILKGQFICIGRKVQGRFRNELTGSQEESDGCEGESLEKPGMFSPKE